ncbi:MAG: FAD-binding protein [Flavobacteriales bacterium]|nr:FAD-binding protein [Flavobacteriales bacterium]
MPKKLTIRLSPEFAFDQEAIRQEILRWTAIKDEFLYTVDKRSLDARKGIAYELQISIYKTGEEVPQRIPEFHFNNVKNRKPVAIIGAGPAGLFAALELIERGSKPVIFERGKDVRSRRRDLAKLNKEHEVNPESNYCFGEGGAGTYSDGKLYTRSKKRGNVQKVLQLLVLHGADQDILVNAHPHIGTNKLPQIITDIRERIIACGGEVHFEQKLTDILIEDNAIKGIEINGNETHDFDQLILATGHSARDIFRLLDKKKVEIQFQSFGLGVRIEHPQQIIDKIQYNIEDRGEHLPPASYSLVHQVENKGVYSFCMCPGGIIAPCATSPGEIVTNGWSPSKRNNPYANSGMVVTVDEKDVPNFRNALSGMEFQASIEQKAWLAGGKTQTAPAQRLTDYLENKVSSTLPDCSYQPGIKSASIKDIIPEFIHFRLQEAFKAFGKKMQGFLTNEAVVVATESRSSSPVRIPRDKNTLQHIRIKGLYPCGEGAGYAGGIVSAAIDGQRCAEAIMIEDK